MTFAHPRFDRQPAAMLVGTLLVALLAGCGGSGSSAPSAADEDLLDWSRAAALRAAGNCEEAEQKLEDHAIAQMEMNLEANRRCLLDPASCWIRGGGEVDGLPVLGAPAPGENANDDDAPENFSETNVQVEGVDEADRVKSDGTHLYTLSDRDLVIVRAWPPTELAEVARIELRSWPQGFFLDGDRAVVLGHANLEEVTGNATPPAGESPLIDAVPPGFDRYRAVASVTVIDLADRSAPRIVDEYFFDGNLIDSRRIGSRLHLAQDTFIWFDDLEYWPHDIAFGEEVPEAEIEAAFAAIYERNVERIRARGIDDWLPRFWRAAGDGSVDRSAGQPVGSCTDVYSPSVFSGQSLLSLITLDLDRGSVASSTIQGAWGTVYASLDAIYIGSSNQEFSWRWRTDTSAPEVRTHIHKFRFDTNGDARYAASGEVVGQAINQFAFDEHAGHLRVATTDGIGWWNDATSESRVTVLRQAGDRLEVTGLVTGLGPDERIFSVRFLGDRGYVVTFRQVDPLYVLDLANPAAPRVAGELKIPGFSSYIHPLAEGFLLTAGRDGDEEGNVGGVKIEVFDVRDPARPRSVTAAVVGDGWNTWSEVLWDHKAFVFFRARNLLAIPVSGWIESTSPSGWWGEYKSELALFRVTPESVTPLPGISHLGLLEEFGGNADCRGYGGYWQSAIFRGVFADDFVYSLSHLGIEVHDTRDLAAGPLARVAVLDPGDFGFYDWNECGPRVDPAPGDER